MVKTMFEFERELRDGTVDLSNIKNVVMIQCAGSREPDRPYCSRVCCNQSIRNAILIKEFDSSINVTVLYREIMSYGLNEAAYRCARQLGVQFVRYEDDNKPIVAEKPGHGAVGSDGTSVTVSACDSAGAIGRACDSAGAIDSDSAIADAGVSVGYCAGDSIGYSDVDSAGDIVSAGNGYSDRDGYLEISSYDPILAEYVTYQADLLLLASAIEPETEQNRAIARILKLPLTQEGFFLEAHAKLRPVDFATEGVYLCGLAHSPKNLKESIVQGKAAASRAATVISKEYLESEGAVAFVDSALCAACGECELVCAYKAITMEDVMIRGQKVRKAVINDLLCKGCGTCAAACRCGAIDLNGFSDEQVVSEIEYLLRLGPPR
jgi:heterodisulfide reductase subunit A-like polyferredoxin